MLRTRFLLVLMLAALALVVSSTVRLGNALANAPAQDCAHRTVVYEDDPCWTWTTMGNRKRGVVTLWGTPKVVGPCAFRALWNAGATRYTLTGLPMMPKLRGDAYALRLAPCPHTPPVRSHG